VPTNAEVNLNIICDNDACPGNVLDPTDRTGWLFVTVEPYGSPVNTGVFCCAECIAANSDSLAQIAEASFPPPAPTEAEPEAVAPQ
jgi:hypothetical protein